MQIRHGPATVTEDAPRKRDARPLARAGKARGEGSGVRRPPSDPSTRTLVERGPGCRSSSRPRSARLSCFCSSAPSRPPPRPKLPLRPSPPRPLPPAGLPTESASPNTPRWRSPKTAATSPSRAPRRTSAKRALPAPSRASSRTSSPARWNWSAAPTGSRAKRRRNRGSLPCSSPVTAATSSSPPPRPTSEPLPEEEGDEFHVYRRDLRTEETTLVDRVSGDAGQSSRAGRRRCDLGRRIGRRLHRPRRQSRRPGRRSLRNRRIGRLRA